MDWFQFLEIADEADKIVRFIVIIEIYIRERFRSNKTAYVKCNH